jgi:hypothetical protein
LFDLPSLTDSRDPALSNQAVPLSPHHSGLCHAITCLRPRHLKNMYPSARLSLPRNSPPKTGAPPKPGSSRSSTLNTSLTTGRRFARNGSESQLPPNLPRQRLQFSARNPHPRLMRCLVCVSEFVPGTDHHERGVSVPTMTMSASERSASFGGG